MGNFNLNWTCLFLYGTLFKAWFGSWWIVEGSKLYSYGLLDSKFAVYFFFVTVLTALDKISVGEVHMISTY